MQRLGPELTISSAPSLSDIPLVHFLNTVVELTKFRIALASTLSAVTGYLVFTRAVGLGQRRLRSETAAVAALTLLMHHLGEL